MNLPSVEIPGELMDAIIDRLASCVINAQQALEDLGAEWVTEPEHWENEEQISMDLLKQVSEYIDVDIELVTNWRGWEENDLR